MKYYKYCSKEHLIENLEKNQIFANRIDILNDPFELFFDFKISNKITPSFCEKMFGPNFIFSKYNPKEITNKLVDTYRDNVINKYGFSSFSKNNRSILMWGHYADKFKGVCLEFDSKDSIFNNVREIEYSENPYLIKIETLNDLIDDNLYKHGCNICFNKCINWAYEEEVRIIYEPEKLLNYSPSSLTGIYFGYNTPIELINDIFNINESNNHIKYYKSKLSRRCYKIDFKQVVNGKIKCTVFRH